MATTAQRWNCEWQRVILWTGSTEDEDEEFIAFIKDYAAKSRPKVLELLEKYSGKNIIILKERQDADAFLRGMSK